MTPEEIRANDILIRTTEILAKLLDTVNWVSFQNAAHDQAEREYDQAHATGGLRKDDL